MNPVARSRSGALLGKKARVTRAAILKALQEDIDDGVPWRQLSATDAARAAGRSIASFYQHWPTVEAAVIEIANDMAARKTVPSEHFRQIIVLLGVEGHDVPGLPEPQVPDDPEGEGK